MLSCGHSLRSLSVLSCVCPRLLVNALLTEERSSETIDLRVPEALLEHLYGAGRVSGLKKSPILWNEFLSGEISVALH